MIAFPLIDNSVFIESSSRFETIVTGGILPKLLIFNRFFKHKLKHN